MTTIARTQHHSQMLSKVSLCLCEYPSKQVVHLPERGGTATTIPLEPIMLKPSSEKPPPPLEISTKLHIQHQFQLQNIYKKKDTDTNQGHLPFFLSQMYMNNLTTNEAYEVKVRGATRCFRISSSSLSLFLTPGLSWVRKNCTLANGRRRRLCFCNQVQMNMRTN